VNTTPLANKLGALEHDLDPTRLVVPFSALVCAGVRGAETAALQVAEAARIRVGGWSYEGAACPPTGATLTPGPSWTQAVAHNARDSDATLVFTYSTPNGPPRIAIRRAIARQKPAVHVQLRPRGVVSATVIDQLRAWLVKNQVGVLHVTGSRQEIDAGIEQATADVLVAIIEAAS